MSEHILIPAIAILSIFVVLPWMVLNFLSRRRDNAIAAGGDPAMNAQLIGLADRIEKRLDAIETLLDHEIPGWRRDISRRNA